MTLMSPVPIMISVLSEHKNAYIFIMVNRCWTATVNHNIPDEPLRDLPFGQL